VLRKRGVQSRARAPRIDVIPAIAVVCRAAAVNRSVASYTAAMTGKGQAASPGPVVGDERIVLHTNRGDLVIGLYDTVAPKHAAQIRKLVRLGVYDSTYIFRVEPGFVAQVVNAQNRKLALTREQHAAIAAIPAEFSHLQHHAGVVSMARDDDDINSAETSFSFVLARARELDGKFTIIGEVQFGRPLLAMIAREPRDDRNRPYNPIVIERGEVKAAAQIAQMQAAHELRDAIPLPKRVPGPRPH
jgi:cyclophilin family peptidyl-prolyl cis-trans isomerase